MPGMWMQNKGSGTALCIFGHLWETLQKYKIIRPGLEKYIFLDSGNDPAYPPDNSSECFNAILLCVDKNIRKKVNTMEKLKRNFEILMQEIAHPKKLTTTEQRIKLYACLAETVRAIQVQTRKEVK